MNITRDMAIQRAKNYRNGKAGLQTAVYWAVQQTLHGNADGLFAVMRAAEMLSNVKGTLFTGADGRQLWKYWNAPAAEGGLGLKGLVAWNEKEGKFKMTKAWNSVAAEIDMAELHVRLTATRWDLFAKVRASRAFDLDKAVSQLLTRATKNGISVISVLRKVEEAAVAANPAGTEIPRIELPAVEPLKIAA